MIILFEHVIYTRSMFNATDDTKITNILLQTRDWNRIQIIRFWN